MKTQIDRKNYIHELEEVAMTDPFRPKNSLAESMNVVRKF